MRGALVGDTVATPSTTSLGATRSRFTRARYRGNVFAMPFFQEPPRLGNQFDDDPLLRTWVARFLPEIAPELHALGDLAVEHYGKQLADRENEPVLTQWDAWGQRIDRIEVSPLWREAQGVAARHGMVAAGYEPRFGAKARVHQFSIVHVLSPSLDVYSCPLAMTDGAAATLRASGNAALIERYVPRLTSRDPARDVDEAGQWMTERTGGSDVSQSETVAKRQGRRYLAPVGHEVVHVGDHRADGADARAAGGKPRG